MTMVLPPPVKAGDPNIGRDWYDVYNEEITKLGGNEEITIYYLDTYRPGLMSGQLDRTVKVGDCNFIEDDREILPFFVTNRLAEMKELAVERDDQC